MLNSRERRINEKDKVLVVSELRHKYKLSNLLKLSGLPRSTYYYHLKRLYIARTIFTVSAIKKLTLAIN